MNRPHRSFLGPLALLAWAGQGCGPAHDRQGIYTVPRAARAPAGKEEGNRARAPSVEAHVPAAGPGPRRDGVDVPIIEPE